MGKQKRPVDPSRQAPGGRQEPPQRERQDRGQGREGMQRPQHDQERSQPRADMDDDLV